MTAKVFPYIPQSKVDIMFNFESSLVKSFDGREQVQAYQPIARLNLKHTYILKARKAEQVLSNLYKYQNLIIPLWYQAYYYSGIISSGTDVINFDTTKRDFDKAKYVFITDRAMREQNPSTTPLYQLLEIDYVIPTSIKFKSQVSRDYISPYIVPAFEAYITANPMYYEYPEDGLFDLTIDFALINRLSITVLSPAGSLIFKNRIVLNFPNYFSGNSSTTTLESGFRETNFNTGIVRSYSSYLTPPILRPWGLWGAGYQKFRDLIQFVYKLKGMQTLVYVPTYRNEFIPVVDAPSGSMYFDVRNADFADIADWMMKSRAIYFKTPDGVFIKEIDHIQDINEFTSRIYLTESLNYSLKLGKNHICWLILSRSASNYYHFSCDEAENYTCDMSFVEVRDE